MECDPIPQRLLSEERPDHEGRHKLALSLDDFAWAALTEQAAKLETPVDELAAFAVLYYLADLDSKRIARLLPTHLRRSSSEPESEPE